MILREIAASWGSSSGPWFSTRWSQENCIVCARTRHCEYPLSQQRLCIKAVWGGREDCFIDGRRVSIDDDTFIILGEAHIYASRLNAVAPVTTFSIFFRPHLLQDVRRTLASSPERMLGDPYEHASAPVDFSENVRRHDRSITPVLNFIRHHVEAGLADEAWYEEQLRFLLQRMLGVHRQDVQTTELIPAARPATRKELFRRVGLGADFINTHFAEPIALEDIAAAAMLSPYHCLRVFKVVHGCTPNGYLTRKRIQAAERLLQSSATQVDEVAANVGFQSRTTLFRQMRHLRGLAPSTIRNDARRREPREGRAAPPPGVPGSPVA